MNEELFPELNQPPPQFLTGDDVVTKGTHRSWATFSKCGKYRYALGRIWQPDYALLICGMLNPSKANESILDNTIRRVVGFAKRDKFGGIIIWNAEALISTDPKALLKHSYPCGPRNFEAIQNIVGGPLLAKVVIAWGKPPSRRLYQSIQTAEIIVRSRRNRLWQFGPSTKEGFPRHPLYLRADTPLIPRR